MRTLWVGLAIALLPGPALAATWLQCDQAELKDPSCTTLTMNYTPLHFTASCYECTGGGADIQCTPGEKVTAQVLGVETVTGNQPVAGTFSQQGTCDFQMPLWKFTGALTKGVTYNVVITVAGHPKYKILTFTAGTNTPAVDSGVPPPPPPPGDGGSLPPGDGGGSSTGDGGGSSTGDGGTGNNNGDEDGCSCRLTSTPGSAPLVLLGILALSLLRRRR